MISKGYLVLWLYITLSLILYIKCEEHDQQQKQQSQSQYRIIDSNKSKGYSSKASNVNANNGNSGQYGNLNEQIKQERYNVEFQNRYFTCFIILINHLKYDYMKIANVFLGISNADIDKLNDKYFYENLENCIRKINKTDVQFVIQNLENNQKIYKKVPGYVLDLSNISSRLELPLTQTQNQLKQLIKQEYNDHLQILESYEKLIKDKLQGLLELARDIQIQPNINNHLRYNKTICKVIFWTFGVIVITMIFLLNNPIMNKSIKRDKPSQTKSSQKAGKDNTPKTKSNQCIFEDSKPNEAKLAKKADALASKGHQSNDDDMKKVTKDSNLGLNCSKSEWESLDQPNAGSKCEFEDIGVDEFSSNLMKKPNQMVVNKGWIMPNAPSHPCVANRAKPAEKPKIIKDIDEGWSIITKNQDNVKEEEDEIQRKNQMQETKSNIFSNGLGSIFGKRKHELSPGEKGKKAMVIDDWVEIGEKKNEKKQK